MSLFLGVLSAAVTNKLAGLENSSKAEIPNKKLLSETNQTGVLPNFFKKRFCFALRAISRLAVVAHSVEYIVQVSGSLTLDIRPVRMGTELYGEVRSNTSRGNTPSDCR